MSGINKVIILGRLGKDPDMKYQPNGNAIANFTVATSETWKDKATGEKKELTEWHRIVIFGKLAEICGEYLKKGAQVYLEGKNKTRKWQAQDGTDRYSTEIVCNEMQMLGKSQETQPKPVRESAESFQQGQQQQKAADFDDAIPF